jgi:hypothetical protein
LNSYNWHSGLPNYQMTTFVFFIFKSSGEGEGWFEDDSKETSKGWVCDNFPRQFHFFLGTIHEKLKFKYFKNLTVKVCKIWCNDVYKYILQCDIFWWNLNDRNFWVYSWRQRVILVSEDSNRYAHLFLIERGYFGFNTFESVIVE